ncbi:putative Cell growth-regulating nucleolar protein [Helianthus anomalus]
MVWFQCEDCGDNLKKPKLASHFRSCSANKLSCIDCGQMFGQQTVQGHTQCMTEMVYYIEFWKSVSYICFKDIHCG